MFHQLRLLLAAVQYVTRLPVPASIGHDPARLGAAMRYLPLVGAGVGALGAAVHAAAARAFPPTVAVLLSVLATVLATGAFHEDGLADCCDGLFGGWTREDALRIMKDSRIGSFGALGLGLVLALKVAALAALPSGAVAAALVAGHAGSRLAAVALIAALPYVRDDEGARARPAAAGVGAAGLAVAAACGLLPLLPLGARALPALLVGTALACLMARWFRRRLRGVTGDCLGAAQQVVEVGLYLAVLAR